MSDFNIEFEENDQQIKLEFEQAGGGAVKSVNGKTGVVVLDADDVGAYTKPSGGIPKTDLATAVQTSLGKADTAYQKPSGGIPANDIASGVVPAVDNTLAISGAAADAKKVGDEIGTLKDGLSNVANATLLYKALPSANIASFKDGAKGLSLRQCIVDDENANKIKVTGKNLIDYVITAASSGTVYSTPVYLPAGEYYAYIFVSTDAAGFNSYMQYSANGSSFSNISASGTEQYCDASMGYNRKKCKITLTVGGYCRQAVQQNAETNGATIYTMLTVDGTGYGSAANAPKMNVLSDYYVSYNHDSYEQTITVDSNGIVQETINVLDGWNSIWANSGNVQVTYYVDSNTVISNMPDEISTLQESSAAHTEEIAVLEENEIKNNSGWVNTTDDALKVLYNRQITPTMHHGTINFTTGVVTEDASSDNVYSDLFEIDSDTQLILMTTGFRRRIVRYSKSTGSLVDGGAWTGETYDRLSIIKPVDDSAYRLAFYGTEMSDPSECLQFVYSNVRIYSGSDDGIANYLRTEYNQTIQDVQALSDAKTVSFAFMTDLHFSNKNSGYGEPLLRTGIVNTKNVLKRFAAEFPLDFAVFGGDYMQMPTIAGGMTVQSGIDNLMEINRWLSDVPCPHIAIAGNHEVGFRSGGAAAVEAGTDCGLTHDQIYTLLNKRYINSDIKEASRYVFYKKDDINGIMWVFVSHPTTSFNETVQDGFDIVVSANTGSYPLVVFSHYGLNNVGEISFNANSAIDYLVVTKGQSIIAWISGHIHGDWSAVYNNILVVSCLQSGNATSEVSQDGTTYTHTAYSDTESALSVFTINKTTGKLYCTRFGLGVDREFNYNTTSGNVGLVV